MEMPVRIVAAERGEIRIVRATFRGVKYALAYTHTGRLFGEKLRRRRRQLLQSMEVTLKMAEARRRCP